MFSLILINVTMQAQLPSSSFIYPLALEDFPGEIVHSTYAHAGLAGLIRYVDDFHRTVHLLAHLKK